MERVLVAGATGALGRHVLHTLNQRGYYTRALCRNDARARSIAAHDIFIADALKDNLAPALDNIDVVFSCLGQTVAANFSIRAPGYLDVDVPANRNLLDAARNANIRRFVYVSVLHADKHPGVPYMHAHALVAKAIRESGLSYAIIEPTGFFSAFYAFLDMVRKNQAMVFGDGHARTNPIHDADLAEICADALAERNNITIEAGGPTIYSRLDVIELARSIARKNVTIRKAPLWVPFLMGKLAKWHAPRIADLMGFVHLISREDFIAPRRGRRELADFYRNELATPTV
ncbi:MAG: SDR family oxidoreductase [Acidobacteria bacterium]|nr:SDR family oxidoreductase [Acidobacteriota bacterium]